jgi:hypothetical protein
VALYTRIGFRLIGARPTWLWRLVTDQPVENRCYGLRLK